VYGLVLFEF
jgi:hypothetical protein